MSRVLSLSLLHRLVVALAACAALSAGAKECLAQFGGGGGGGAGGPSYGLYRTGTTVSLAGNNISAGNGGSGGPGGFPNGAAGVAGAAINAN